MKKWTQQELVLEYVKRYGSIIPAKVGGSPFLDGFFGSETPKRCRELRKGGTLVSLPSKQNPKFEEFFFPGQPTLI